MIEMPRRESEMQSPPVMRYKARTDQRILTCVSCDVLSSVLPKIRFLLSTWSEKYLDPPVLSSMVSPSLLSVSLLLLSFESVLSDSPVHFQALSFTNRPYDHSSGTQRSLEAIQMYVYASTAGRSVTCSRGVGVLGIKSVGAELSGED